MARRKATVDGAEIVKSKDAIDWIALSEKLQESLSKEMNENQRLERERYKLLNDISNQMVIIQYLESKLQ
jgi:hypothetical protein